MSAEYEGNLRCKVTHDPSGTTLITDAPVDNKGEGASFSPTDLFALSLASCIATIMGIQAQLLKIDLKGMTYNVSKEMASDAPRRVAKIKVDFFVPCAPDEKNRERLMKAVDACPVSNSIHPDIKKEIHFHWKEE